MYFVDCVGIEHVHKKSKLFLLQIPIPKNSFYIIMMNIKGLANIGQKIRALK